ncbi:MAG TPA: hypothetical protein VMM93_07780 [Vicinamibacterales bacterium]|nr:hypothetical protein [Vicinamibacterales bacterium]
MPTPDQSRPADPTRRHERAAVELGSTTVAPVTARVLVTGFLAALAVVPAIEATGVPALVHESFVDRQLPGGGQPGAGVWRRLVAGNRAVLAGFTGFERALEHESRLGQWLRPPTQALLTGRLGAGNERVYPGRDGWLFYRADVEYVTGPGFLNPAVLRRRVRSASEWETPPRPDPRPAIVQFADDLAARGITLIVMPVPLKPGVHPEQLAATVEVPAGVLHNPSYASLLDDLGREGLVVFDPSAALAEARRTAAAYLQTDTHWRPETMEVVAGQLAAFIRATVTLPDVVAPDVRIDRVEVANTGDTARMLDLADGSLLFPPESVWLRRILGADGALWASTRGADVLLLGDSFSNIYSLASLEWGTSAGLAEQLSYTLGRPLDRIIRNDDGAFATRELLVQDPGRLEGTRVVVWQFATRELAFGDWKVLPLR